MSVTSLRSVTRLDVGGEFQAILDQLKRDRLQFDLEKQLQEALETAHAPYSFWRLKGFQDVTEVFFKATASTESMSALQHVLSLHWSGVLQNCVETINPLTSQTEATISTSWNGKGISEAEQTEALRVLQALCLVYPLSRDPAGRAGVVEVLVSRLRRFNMPEAACACIDAILALLLDNDANQARLVQLQGIEKICLLLRADDTPPPVRKRAAECLNLLVTQVLPEGPPVDLRKRAQRSLSAQLGASAAQVLLEQVEWGGADAMDKDHVEFQLQDLSAATLARLAAE